MSILQHARFFTTADQLHQLPALGIPEVAFAGRSNAGKSTAINTLCNQKRLAFTSKTPGRTQHINLFSVGRQEGDPELPLGFLVDLPGYGYAAVSQAVKIHWEELLASYVRQRRELVGLVLMMDARRPMTDLDLQLIDWFAATGKAVHVLLTKADKLNRSQAILALRGAREALTRYGPQHSVQLFSSLKRTGVEEAESRVLGMLGVVPQVREGKVVP